MSARPVSASDRVMSELRAAPGTHRVPCWFPHSPDCTCPVSAAPDRPMSFTREQEIREYVATMTNLSTGNLAARDLLAELDRARAERTEMTLANADWLEGIGQDHAADMLRYSLDMGDLMDAAEMRRANGDPKGGA